MVEQDIGGPVWNALVEGLPPDEQAELKHLVTKSLREQRAALIEGQKPPGGDAGRSRGRPRNRNIT
jgi:hypothetical protein